LPQARYRPGGLAVKSKGEGAHPQTPGNEDPNSVSVVAPPDCFEDHNAPQSVRVLFERWVQRADESDSGRIEILKTGERNPKTGKPYSTRTVAKAREWLVAHHMLVLTKPSRGGRGHGPIYHVRWSIAYPGLRSRQNHQNMKSEHTTQAQTGTASQSPYAREGVLEENQARNENTKAASRPSQVGAFPNEHDRSPNPPVTDRLQHWIFARWREAVDGIPWVRGDSAVWLIEALGVSTIRALEAGHIRRGLPLACVIAELADDDVLGFALPESALADRRAAFAWAGWLVGAAVDAFADPDLDSPVAEIRAHLAELQANREVDKRTKPTTPREEILDSIDRLQTRLDRIKSAVDAGEPCPRCHRPITRWEWQEGTHPCVGIARTEISGLSEDLRILEEAARQEAADTTDDVAAFHLGDVLDVSSFEFQPTEQERLERELRTTEPRSTTQRRSDPEALPDRFARRQESAGALDVLKGSAFEKLSDMVKAYVEAGASP